MSRLDLILKNGQFETHGREAPLDIGVADGKIVELEPNLTSAREIIDCAGLHIFPGLIDSHVHFNDPGRAHWEGIETGSRALAAGGGTMFFDMPLNSSPPTLDGESFDLKRGVAEKTSLTDFALWGGLTPGNLNKLEELAERGVIGFKAFMSNSGIEDFPRADDHTLREGMRQAAKLGKIVAVHAESEPMTGKLATEALAQGRITVRDYLDSRPVAAELEAISRAIELGGETGCALHVVHVSSGAGVMLVKAGRERGVDVTCETCPHYLTLIAEDMEKLGAVAKCAPPLREKAVAESLWQRGRAAKVNTIGSDHSPAPPDMKVDENFFKVWGGISGIQHTLPLLITEGCVKRNVDLWLIERLTSSAVANRFSLSDKGRIGIGWDADFALVDLKAEFTVRAEDLFYRHKQSPYVGRALTGRVVRTILRGQTIFRDGKIVSRPAGKFVEPTRR